MTHCQMIQLTSAMNGEEKVWVLNRWSYPNRCSDLGYWASSCQTVARMFFLVEEEAGACLVAWATVLQFCAWCLEFEEQGEFDDQDRIPVQHGILLMEEVGVFLP